MARYLLDTDAVIDYLKGQQRSITFLQEIDQRGNQLCVCDVVIVEIYTGLPPLGVSAAEAFLESCYYLATPPAAARLAGEWRYRFARRGVSVALTDAMIAATGHAHGATVVTGNVRDYPMEEVNILPLPRG